MPEAYNKDAALAAGGQKAVTGYGLPSAPAYSFDIPDIAPPDQESIFHPVKALENVINAVHALTTQVNLLVKDSQHERTFIDRPAQIGATIAYTADYLEHKFLYALSPTNITLVPSTGGTLALTGNTWKNISLPRGTTFTVQGGSDAAPAVVVIRACDVYMG